MVELEASGTHDGPFSLGPDRPPVAATGTPVRIQGIFVAIVDEGKIVEIRQYPNGLGLLMQLGVLSPPGSE